MEDRQPSRVVEDAADCAVGLALAAPANAAHGFCELCIFLCHGLVGLWLRGLSHLVGLLPGYPLGLLALIARLAFGSRLDEAALFGRLGGGGQHGYQRGK